MSMVDFRMMTATLWGNEREGFVGHTGDTLDLDENLMGLCHWDRFLKWLEAFEAISMGETEDGLGGHSVLPTSAIWLNSRSEL